MDTYVNSSLQPACRSRERLQQYWNVLRDDGPFHTKSEIGPDDIADIWPSCFLNSLDEVMRCLEYLYTYLADRLTEVYGDDIESPNIILRLLSAANTPFTEKFFKAIRSMTPVRGESEFVNLKHMSVRYRKHMVPPGINTTHVTHILGCMC